MNAQAILDKIQEDARQAAVQVQADAEAKAAEMRKAAAVRSQQRRDELVSQAQKEGGELAVRMQRMAELEERKALLQTKRDMMDEAFALAGQKLCQTPKARMRAFFAKQVERAAVGHERLIIGEDNAQWFDDAFVNEINLALSQQGKPAKLTASSERRAGCTGVILATEGAEVHCTFQTLLETSRDALEAEVAAILFHA